MHESATVITRMDASDDPGQLAYTIPHAAHLLDMSPRKVWALVHSGEIPSFKIGKARRVSRRALVEYIERLEQAA